MEADWEVEIGPDAPTIDAAWDGFVDLRREPSRIFELQEAARLPALAQSLVRLNAPSSPVWTSKCDVWSSGEFDPDELAAERENAAVTMACYIDLIPVERPATLEPLVEWCRRLCVDLRSRSLRQCRVDTVIRKALITADTEGLAVSLYVIGSGASPQDAGESLSRALVVLADSVLATSAVPPSKYNQNIVGE